MEDKKLNDGNAMPVLGLGTYKSTGKDCLSAVKTALKLGYTHIDTAKFYGNESQIGEAIKEQDRSKLFITSKIWLDRLSYEHTLEDAEDSLKRLGTGYLDLLLIHWPNTSFGYDGFFRACKQLKEDGKLRSVGVSNFTIHHLRDAMPVAKKYGCTIVNNQVEFHPGLYQRGLLEFCKEHGIVLTAYSPLKRGALLDDTVLVGIAKKHGKTVAQVALRWLLQHGIIIIPKGRSETHIHENMELFDFELSEEETSQIDEMGDKDRLVDKGWSDFDY